MFLEPRHTIHKLLVCGCSEIANAYVAHFRPDHVYRIDGGDGYLVARDIEGQQAIDTTAQDAEPHGSALLSTQTLHNLLFRHFHARYCRVVDCHNTVASHDADFL